MAKVVLEENGNVLLLEDEDNQSVYIEQNGEESALKKGKKQIKNNNKNWEVISAEFENQNILTAWLKKKGSTKNIQVWKHNEFGKYINKKSYSQSNGKYYAYETLFEEDFNADDYVGYIYSQLDDTGNTFLFANNLGKLSITGPSDNEYSNIYYKSTKNLISSETKTWFSIAAETINNQNYLVQINKNNNGLKIYSGQSDNWLLQEYSYIKTTSNAYYEWEIITNEDLNNDGFIGFELSLFENKGSVSTYKNVLEQVYTYDEGEYIPIYYKGAQVSLDNFDNQSFQGLETKKGVNKMIWEHSSGNLIEWNMDNDWNFEKSQLAQYQSYEYFVIEDYLEEDLDGDFYYGLKAEDYNDSLGIIYLKKDSVDNIYSISSASKNENVDEFKPLYHKGSQINTQTFSDYVIMGVESIENEEYLLLEKNSGDLKIYELNTEGNTGEYQKIKYQNPMYFQTEENFKQDLDGDGNKGFVMDDPFESIGQISLVTDQVKNIYADKIDSDKVSIKYKNEQVKVNQFSGLSMLGAETDQNSNNIIAWENEESELSVWKLDDDWNYLSYKNIEMATVEYYSVEKQFLQDFDGDGKSGFSYKDIENDGTTSLKIDEQMGFAFVDEVILEQDISNSFGGFSLKNETTAIKYQGSEVVENSFTEQFGLYLLGAETSGQQQYVAWADGDLNLTIWETNDDWEYSKAINIVYNTSDFLEYETIFNQDWNNDGVIGGQTSIIEEDKFVTLSTDQLGFVIITKAGKEFEVGFDGQKLNINSEWWDTTSNEGEDISYSLLAAECNLWNNQVENQLAWGYYEDNVLTKILLWELNNDWSDLIAITEVIKTEDEVNNEFDLLELAFDSDLDSNSSVGNDYEGFYAFGSTIKIDGYGNTILNQSTDGLNLYVIDDSLYISEENNLDNSIELKFSDDSQSITTYLTTNNLTAIAAESISGTKSLIAQDTDFIYQIIFNDNWELDASSINLLDSQIKFGTKEFIKIESLLDIDIDNDELIGLSNIDSSDTILETDGEFDLLYTQDKNYLVKSPDGSTSLLDLSWMNTDSNIVGVENNISPVLLIYNGDGLYTKYESSNGEWNNFIVLEEFNFNDVQDSQSIKQDFEALESEFDVDINQNGIIGSKKTIENNGDTLLIHEASGYISIQTKNNDDLNVISVKGKKLIEGKGLLKKWNVYAAEKINGQNQLLLKSNKSEKIKLWNFDENWKYKNTVTKANQDNLYELEKVFGVDLNNDTVQGSSFSTYEVGGSISLSKDVQGNLGINSEFLENPVYIKKNKYSFFKSPNKAFSVQGADNFNGKNIVISTNKKGTIKATMFNDLWDKQLKTKTLKSNNKVYYDYEAAFDQDFNGDGFTGIGYKSVESKGIELTESSLGFAFALESETTNEQVAITTQNGKGIKVSTKSWNIAGLTETNSNNYMAKLNKSTSKLKLFEMNDSWKLDKLINSVSSNEDKYFELEESFEQDFNGDSLIGKGFVDIETDGIILKQDQFGIAFANSGSDENIQITNKNGMGLKIDGKNWNIIALTEVESTNYMAKQNNSGTKIKIYQMGENWTQEKLFKTLSHNNNNDVLYAEQLFDQTLFE